MINESGNRGSLWDIHSKTGREKRQTFFFDGQRQIILIHVFKHMLVYSMILKEGLTAVLPLTTEVF